MVYCIVTFLIYWMLLPWFSYLYICQIVVLILLNVKIFKVSLFQKVALTDSFKLSARQFVSGSRLVLIQRLLLHALKQSDDFCLLQWPDSWCRNEKPSFSYKSKALRATWFTQLDFWLELASYTLHDRVPGQKWYRLCGSTWAGLKAVLFIMLLRYCLKSN